MAEDSKRRIFFWTLAVLFFVTTGTLVLYALGYRFSAQRGVFIYGGSVTVKSNPRQVNIFLNKEPLPKNKTNYLNSSYHIDGIRPGEYLLEISSPGYQTWSKKIAIHSGISTEFWNVLLAKEEYPRTKFNISPSGRFFLSPKNSFIAYPESRGQEFLANILNVKSGEYNTIFSSPDFQFTSDEQENIKWSPQETTIIIPAIAKDNVEHYFIIYIDTKRTIDLKDLAQTQNLSDVRWDPEKKNIIYYISENNLYRMDIGNSEDKKIIAQNIAGYDLSPNKIYYFQLPSGIVYTIPSDQEAQPSQITTTPPADMSDIRFKIIAYDEKRIIFFNNYTHKLFLWNEGDKDNYFQELSGDARGAQFSDDGKKLLFWNDWEIFVYFTRDWNVQPTRSENEILDIARFSQSVQNVQWSKDYEHVIFTEEKKIKIGELDHRDYLNIMDIAALSSDNVYAVEDFPDNKLYFTDTEGDNSSFNLNSIDFPEKSGILGIGG